MLKKNYKIICNIVCSVLILVLLVLQFLPGYWTCQKATPEEDGSYKTESASLQEYMWLPSEFSLFEKHFENQFGKDFILNDAVMMPVITLVVGVLCLFFTALKPNESWTAIFPAIVGGTGVYGYLCYPIFQMNGSWVIHLVICILILAVALASIVTSVTKRILAFKQELKDIASRA